MTAIARSAAATSRCWLREKHDVRLVNARQEPAFAARYGLDLDGDDPQLDGGVPARAPSAALAALQHDQSNAFSESRLRAWSIRSFAWAATLRSIAGPHPDLKNPPQLPT